MSVHELPKICILANHCHRAHRAFRWFFLDGKVSPIPFIAVGFTLALVLRVWLVWKIMNTVTVIDILEAV